MYERHLVSGHSANNDSKPNPTTAPLSNPPRGEETGLSEEVKAAFEERFGPSNCGGHGMDVSSKRSVKNRQIPSTPKVPVAEKKGIQHMGSPHAGLTKSYGDKTTRAHMVDTAVYIEHEVIAGCSDGVQVKGTVVGDYNGHATVRPDDGSSRKHFLPNTQEMGPGDEKDPGCTKARSLLHFLGQSCIRLYAAPKDRILKEDHKATATTQLYLTKLKAASRDIDQMIIKTIQPFVEAPTEFTYDRYVNLVRLITTSRNIDQIVTRVIQHLAESVRMRTEFSVRFTLLCKEAAKAVAAARDRIGNHFNTLGVTQACGDAATVAEGQVRRSIELDIEYIKSAAPGVSLTAIYGAQYSLESLNNGMLCRGR